MAVNKKHVGGKFEDFLKADGIYEEVMGMVAKKQFALQFKRAMKDRKFTKTRLAEKLHTSRAQIERIISPDNVTVSIGTVERAAEAVGCRVRLVLEPISVA